MTTGPARAGADWLALREPADAAARSVDLVATVRPFLPYGDLLVHDLGSGTGSMTRWLAPQLPGHQTWVLHDRDAELLERTQRDHPCRAADGASVDLRLRCDDVTRLGAADLSGVDLITASALLDMLTSPELDRLVGTCAAARCPTLITLSVVGQVAITPGDPLDPLLMAAFNDHQRRETPGGRLLGPDAVAVAADAFAAAGLTVVRRPSPWRLRAGDRDLCAAWFTGWLEAACERQPGLRDAAGSYARARLAQVAAGAVTVTVQHEDLLVLPRG
jgi:hypothetical protein